MSPPSSRTPQRGAAITKDMNALLDNQRKCYNDAIARLEDKFIRHIKDSEKQNHDIIASLEFTQKEVNDLRTQLATAIIEGEKKTKQIELLQQSNQELQQQLQDTAKRVDYMDDQSRRNNLRFTGVKEEPGETWEKCQEKLSNMLHDHLNITLSLERVHRVGKVGDKKPRDIVAKFTSFSDRDNVMRNRRKMKGTNIFINEDLCPASVAVRMQQMPAYHQARKDGKQVYFNYRTLVIRDPVSHHSTTTMSSSQNQLLPRTPPRSPRPSSTSTRLPTSPRHPTQGVPTSPRHPTLLSPRPSPLRQPSTSTKDVVANTDGDDQRASARAKKPTSFYQA